MFGVCETFLYSMYLHIDGANFGTGGCPLGLVLVYSQSNNLDADLSDIRQAV